MTPGISVFEVEVKVEKSRFILNRNSLRLSVDDGIMIAQFDELCRPLISTLT
jgi:hypothetical protein